MSDRMKYPDIGPAAGASRLSALAINPGNEQASAERRSRLLEAFDTLPPSVRADLLEAAETAAFTGTDPADRTARAIFRALYQAAGWE